MRMLKLSFTLPLLVAACGGDDASMPDAAPTDGISGVVTLSGGATVPAGARAFGVWVVSATSPDYAYKHGEGAASGAGWNVVFWPTPPAEALNTSAPFSFGVAVIAIAPAAQVPADGVLPDTAPPPIGMSSRHAVIYKPAGGQGPDWLTAFPEGYSCGVCVDNAAGFDSFTPVACSAVVVDVPADIDTLDVCNWT